ncbi:hypothetical protein FRC12_006397 [Ceratobasidium sp. 428]|nr:hypothetical protein FRC12_006397 [Ceratobasidium sp. 428]
MTTSLSGLFQTSELAYLVFAYLDVDDVARLVSTSRSIFCSAAPWRWKYVTGARNLLSLLPCTEIGTLRCRVARRKGKNFTFHEPVTKLDFRRFDIYAPYVTHFDVFQAPDKALTISGWKFLLDFVDAGHTLLPNLTTLVLRSEDSRRGMSPYPWIAAFAGPSLRRLYIGERLVVSECVMNAIFNRLKTVCPNLGTLELHLDSTMEAQDEQLLPLQGSDTAEPDWVNGFAQLEELIVNSYFLDEHLESISRLPALKRLEVISSGSTREKPILLSDSSFSALREIKLDGFQVSEIKPLWHMPNIVADLGIVEIAIYPVLQPIPTEPGEVEADDPREIVPFLLSRSPQITVLRLNFNSGSKVWCRPGMIDEDLLQILSQHPLSELSLEGVAFSLPIRERRFELLASLFPHLEVLRWPNLLTGLEDLHTFTRMLKLRYLAVCVERRFVSAAVMKSFTWVPLPGNAALKVLEGPFMANDCGSWFRVATYISHLWPNVQLRVASRSGATSTEASNCVEDVDIANAYMEMLKVRGRGNRLAKMDMWTDVGGGWVESGFEF